MKMRNKSETPKIMALLSFTALLSVSCTKPRPYENKAQDKTAQTAPMLKTQFDPNDEYLYSSSSLNSTRTTGATFPMYLGETKIVKLQMSENALRVMEVDTEDRFSGNPLNNKPVLAIPITHVDFHCAKDADGKCTNKEEEDENKPWAKRRYIKIQANQLALQEVSVLPLEFTNLFMNCYQETGSPTANIKIEANAINIDVEKDYKSKIGCDTNISALSDLTFRVVYHYSLVKLNSITHANYNPFPYSRKEESTFGFFDTDTMNLDRDNNATEDGAKKFLNRWMPGQKVTYYLTENFNKPEYAKIKAATYEGVRNINKTLKLAGANLQIDLREPQPGLNPGDLRVNSIVMIEDPLNYGILGYGPTAANPRTGEIVHGRTAMYLGVIKTGIKRAYDDIVKEKLAKAPAAPSKPGEDKTSDGTSDIVTVGGDGKAKFALAPHLAQYSGTRPVVDAKTYAQMKLALDSGSPAASSRSTVQSKMSISTTAKPQQPLVPPKNTAQILKHGHRLLERRLTARDVALLNDDETIREQFLSTNCFYSIDDFNIHDAIEEDVEKIIAEVGAKPWTDLTATEKDKVIDALLPFVWVPTLIHEMGHNLGLRHNFAGSEDKDNFYTTQELTDMGITRPFSYSSVMDYGYRSTNELQVMGKYDLAALRFGYAEVIENAKGDFVPVSEFKANPNLAIKDYKYCTDEHVALNPNCNRFDEGTTLTEMAQHWINIYEESYARRNYRNKLKNFSLYDDLTQIGRLQLIMGSLRTMFERYEDIKKTYRLADDSPLWSEIEFLKQLKQSTQLAARFYLKVLATPDTLCAAARASNPNMIVGVVPLRLLSTNAISCFDTVNVHLSPDFVVVGEAGKSFQSKKDPHSDNPYMDQIDVRGIWLDKLLAAKALTGRITGIESFDEFTGNFLDISDLREEIQTALSNILLDEIVTKVPIQTATGQVLVAELPVKLFDKEDSLNGHKIMKPLHPVVQRYFGIPKEGVDFQSKLVQILASNLPSSDQDSNESSLLNSLLVSPSLPNGQSAEDFLTVNIGVQRFFVNIKSKVAATALINREIVIVFSRLGEEKLKAILATLEEDKTQTEAAPSDDERFAYMLGADMINKYLEDGFQDRSYYDQMLRAMTF